MMIFAGVMIVVIVFSVMVFVLRAAGKNAVLQKKRKEIQDFFLCQMSNFTMDPLIEFRHKEDLLSPSMMSNAGIELIGEEIQMVDYVKNVPWFFYL